MKLQKIGFGSGFANTNVNNTFGQLHMVDPSNGMPIKEGKMPEALKKYQFGKKKGKKGKGKEDKKCVGKYCKKECKKPVKECKISNVKGSKVMGKSLGRKISKGNR